MLAVLFNLGGRRCGLNAAEVHRVLPAVPLHPDAQGLPGVVGRFDYHGTWLPVVDLEQVASGRATLEQLGTRIIVVRLKGEGGLVKLAGLLAEAVTEVRPYSGTPSPDAPEGFQLLAASDLVSVGEAAP